MTLEIRYVKRLEMCFDFKRTPLPDPSLPNDFFWAPWRAGQTETHARLIYTAFHRDVDARVFPTFRQSEACRRLVRSLVSRRDFVPEATWLIGRYWGAERNKIDYCAAIQGAIKPNSTGAIQNVAVIPGCRRRGLGRALVLKCLEGFRSVGCLRATLEATAENAVAVKLYSSLGFEVIRVHYMESFIESNDRF